MLSQNMKPGVAAWWPHRLRALVLMLIPVLLAACTATYAPKPFMGASGYSSTNIDATTVRVEYLTGAGAHHAERARDYVMYRSAEITLERGPPASEYLSPR